MALQLGDAVSDGIRRTFTRTGGILFIGFFAIQLSIQTSINSALLGFLPPAAAEQFSTNAGLALPIPGSFGLAILAVLIILSSAFFVVLSRTLAQPRSELSTFPATAASRNLSSSGSSTAEIFSFGSTNSAIQRFSVLNQEWTPPSAVDCDSLDGLTM